MKRMLLVLAAVTLVLPLSSCWIFGSLFGPGSDWEGPTPIYGGSSTASAAPMSLDTWYTDYISSGETLWYSLPVVPGQMYNIYWDDGYDGSGTYAADIYISAFRMDGLIIYQSQDDGYNSPMTITPSEPIIYLRVTPHDSSSSGDFAIGYEEAN